MYVCDLSFGVPACQTVFLFPKVREVVVAAMVNYMIA